MVSLAGTIPCRLFWGRSHMTSLDDQIEVPREDLLALEERVEEFEQENQQLRRENNQLRAKPRWYQAPHTHRPVRNGLALRSRRPRQTRTETKTTKSLALTAGLRVETGSQTRVAVCT